MRIRPIVPLFVALLTPAPLAASITPLVMEAAAARPQADVAGAIEGRAEFGKLSKLLQASGLSETLASSGPYTVFAPTDAALEAQPRGSMAAWLAPENKPKLRRLLETHVVAGKIRIQDIPEGSTEVPTLSGATLTIVRKGERIEIGGARISAADIAATNGVVHAIRGLAMPDVQTN